MPVNYQLGKIYKIVNSANNIIYIGSTAQKTLAMRMGGHRREALTKTSKWNTAMSTIGVEKFTIVLIHSFQCNTKDELESEEYRVLNDAIAAGTQVYNSQIDGKVDEATKAKISESSKGNTKTFAYGCICLHDHRWKFLWYDNGVQRTKSFSCKKYGDYGAHFRAEEVRRQLYPEWGNDEDIYCDDLGHIYLD